jgi:hypothetical protein
VIELVAAKEIVPALLARLIPASPAPVVLTVVTPKFAVAPAARLWTLMPMSAELVTVVVAIARLPLALVRLMPVVALLVDVTLVNVMPSVVGLTTSAGPPVAAIEPVVTLTVPLLVAETPVPLLVVTANDENENVPRFEFRFTPVPEVVLFTVVAPKLKLVPAGAV